MNQVRILVILLAILGMAGIGAWYIFGGSTDDAPAGPRIAGQQYTDTDEEADYTATDTPRAGTDVDPAEATLTAEQRAEIEAARAEAREHDRRIAEERDDTGNGDQTGDGSSRSGQPGTGSSSRERAGGYSSEPERRLTPAEREEVRREERGRPALRQRLARTPGSVTTSGAVQKTPEQEAWEEEWQQQAITPPPMIPTPVSGKIMSRQAREGLAGATVHIMTFFPLDGVAGGPLLPVITDLKADDKGEFKGEVPGPEVLPQGFPVAAVGVSWEGHRILTAQPVNNFEVGQESGIGIYWAPDHPFRLECNAVQFSGNLSVVSTGQLNPHRIHTQLRHQFLGSFPSFVVTPRDAEHNPNLPSPGEAMLIGSWNRDVRPFISLLRGNELLKTQVPTPRTMVGNDDPPAELPFDTLVFENEAYQPISGVVTNYDGMTVGGAVVTTVGGDITRSVVTDQSGWFLIESPDEGTNALRVYHDEYIEVMKSDIGPGDMNLQIVFEHRRPRLDLEIRDRVNGQPIESMGFRVTGLHVHGPDAGKPMPEGFTEMSSSDGRYVLEWEYPIQSVVLERIGYFPRTLVDPVGMQDDAGGRLEVNLSPGRELVVIPREYTDTRDSSRWYKDPDDGPGIRTNWAQVWIEWDVDFGNEPDEGEEGGYFDLLLGCTNYGLVDNEYEFTIRVYVDGDYKGTLVIPGDNVNVRTGRIPLGRLSGVQRVRLNWTNDVWIPEQLDANVRYASMQFIEQPGPPEED
jgi:hypothetical protein